MTAVQLDLLDVIRAAPMPGRVYLRRLDPERNMSRFYVLSLQPTLFGEIALVREWGRIGKGGQVRSAAYTTLREAEVPFNRLRRSKERRGYI